MAFVNQTKPLFVITVEKHRSYLQQAYSARGKFRWISLVCVVQMVGHDGLLDAPSISWSTNPNQPGWKYADRSLIARITRDALADAVRVAEKWNRFTGRPAKEHPLKQRKKR